MLLVCQLLVASLHFANTPHVATVACSVMFLLCLLLPTSLLLLTTVLLLASLLLLLVPDAPGRSAVGSAPSLANTPHVATVACSMMFLVYVYCC